MKKILTLIVPALLFCISSFAVYPIAGTPGACVGTTSLLYDSSCCGTWSSSSTTIATVDSMGLVTGMSAGTCTITYTVGSSFATMSFTVSPPPAAIMGGSSVCVGSTLTLTDATTGGMWSSAYSSVATINPGTGVVTGVATGTADIYYTTGTGCYASTAVVVGGSAGYIYGDSSICVGSSATLSETISGGTWSTSSITIATISAGGVVSGIAGGTAYITYTVSGSCGGAYTVYSILVTTSASAGSISGSTSVPVGGPYSYYDYAGSGTWSSSNPSVATINPSSGLLTALTLGSTVITFTLSGCGSPITTLPVTVAPVDRISGTIHFPSGLIDSTGTTKVWLITYNSGTFDLEAVDSTIATMTSFSTATYQFMGAATDTYRVKSAYFPTTFDTMGYVPTYHTSALHWNLANLIIHSSTAADDGEDITMNYGTVTTGPGFIGGNVTMGADRATTAGIPAVNMLIFCVNTTTAALMQQTHTDATGAYHFSNLPVGATYTIYPEAINYVTTPYTSMSLTTGSPSNGISFIQHTVSKTITPVPEYTKPIIDVTPSVVVFPNPTSGKLTILYQGNTACNGSVNVTDITGRQVLSANFSMNNGSGTKNIDLTDLNAGLYIISVKADNINYTNKIQLEK